MEKELTAQQQDLESIVRDYLHAMGDRDLSRCMDFYADDAVISMMNGTFRGASAIEEWHKERFAAELELVRLNQIRVKESTVIVDGVITSKRLRSWRIGTVRGTATFAMDMGRIKEVKLGLKMYNPLESW
jgi:hypothetical protein